MPKSDDLFPDPSAEPDAPVEEVVAEEPPAVAGSPAEQQVEDPKVKIVVAEKAPDVEVVDEYGDPTGEVREGAPLNIEYPFSVSVVGLEEDLVFEDANASHEVSPQVAAQFEYVLNVKVAD